MQNDKRRRTVVLIKAQQAQEMLGVKRGQFSSIQPHLLALVLGGRTYRFSRAYIDELRRSMGEEARLPHQAAHFAARPTTSGRISGDVGGVHRKLNAAVKVFEGRQYVPAGQVMDVFHVGRAPVFTWVRDEELGAYVPPGWRSELHISVDSLRTFCRWQYPLPREASPNLTVM